MNTEKLIEQMSVKEKVGQLCVPILQSGEITESIKKAITEKYVGMLRFCPNAEFDNSSEVVGEPNKYRSPDEMAEFINSVQKLTEETPNKIPLFIAVDQEGSTRNDVNRNGAMAYSGHMAFGAVNDEELTYKIAKAAGREFRSMGINLVQAPIIDVLEYDGRATMKAATFGENVGMVTKHALAMMRGYKDGGVASMAKHFPGYGSVATDAHKGVAEITKSFEELDACDIAPLKTLFKNGLNGVMTGHVLTHCIDSEHPATLSEKMITDYLRNELGFDGIVETDAMRMKAIQERYGTAQASVMAIQAGCDMVLLRGSEEHFNEGYNAIIEAVESGVISMERLDESVRRILREKQSAGLFDTPYSSPDEAEKIVGCEEHRELLKRFSEKSITALKDKGLPVKRSERIFTVCTEPQKIRAAMDDIQCPDMLIKAMGTDGMLVKLNPDEDDIKNAVEAVKNYDVIVAGMCNGIIYGNQKELVKALYDTGKKVIVVATDSPYDIELVPYTESFVCTYGVSAAAMEAAAKVIYGELEGNAVPPVTIKI